MLLIDYIVLFSDGFHARVVTRIGSLAFAEKAAATSHKLRFSLDNGERQCAKCEFERNGCLAWIGPFLTQAGLTVSLTVFVYQEI